MHAKNLVDSAYLGATQWDYLIRLCYFDDKRREQQCEHMFRYVKDELEIAGTTIDGKEETK